TTQATPAPAWPTPTRARRGTSRRSALTPRVASAWSTRWRAPRERGWRWPRHCSRGRSHRGTRACGRWRSGGRRRRSGGRCSERCGGETVAREADPSADGSGRVTRDSGRIESVRNAARVLQLFSYHERRLAVYDLTAAVATHFAMHEAAVPPMAQLRNATGETVQLAVLDGREVVYIERLDSPHTLRLFLEVGRRNWAHCTGTGKCLLAYLPERTLDQLLAGWELKRRTPFTITDPQLLRKELKETRHRGWAQNLNESEEGVLSV